MAFKPFLNRDLGIRKRIYSAICGLICVWTDSAGWVQCTYGETEAALVVIGDEILSGRTHDRNIAQVASWLQVQGIRLAEVRVVPDDEERIAAAVNALRSAHDYLFTTGGIGPTHDDVTLAAVAKAFGRSIVRSAEIERLVRGHFKERTNEQHLRMADVPEGAELVRSGEMPWPTVAVENVYVLPGVPEIFQLKLPVLRDRLRADRPFVSRAIFTTMDEFELAPMLDEVAAKHPTVAIGSYLTWSKTDYRVKLTFDGSDRAAVDAAFDDVLRSVGERVVRTS